MELERLHEARPELFTVDFASGTFGEMDFHYIAQIREGTRKLMRLGADRVRKAGFCETFSELPGREASAMGVHDDVSHAESSGAVVIKDYPKVGRKSVKSGMDIRLGFESK